MMTIGIAVLVLLTVAGTCLFFKRAPAAGFKEFVKNPKAWNDWYQDSKKEDQEVIEDSKRWSDTQIASQVKFFVFNIKTADDEYSLGLALEALGSKIHPIVLSFLRDPALRTKLVKPTGESFVPEAPFNRACKLLGDDPPPEAVPAFIPFIDDPSEYIRGDAALALGKTGASEIITPIRKALGDKDDDVRNYALTGLQHAFKRKRISEISRTELFPDLQNLLLRGENADLVAGLLLDFDVERGKAFILNQSFFNPDTSSLAGALSAIAKRGIPAPRDQLFKLIHDLEKTELDYPRASAVAAALRLLGQLRQKDDAAFLEQRLSNSNKEIAQGAAEGLLANAGLKNFQQTIWDKNQNSGYGSLTQKQRNWMSVEQLNAEVNNGGFAQYFVNSSGDQWMDALTGLEAMGSKEMLPILQGTIAKFGKEKPSTVHQQRQEQLARLMRDNDNLFEQLDNRYYSSSELVEVMQARYAVNNAEDFR
jgi:HEAT repeat protein